MLDGIAAIAGSLERVINLPPNFYGRDSTSARSRWSASTPPSRPPCTNTG